MNTYFDTSALVKLYIREPGTAAVQHCLKEAAYSATANITKPELAGALGRALRVKRLPAGVGRGACASFCKDWPHLIRLHLITLATFDRLLWDTSQALSLAVWPIARP